MRDPAISGKLPFELNARLTAGRSTLAEHRDDGLFLLQTIFCSEFYLQVELQFGCAHVAGVLALSRIRESPSSSVRIGVRSCPQVLAHWRETSRGRGARPDIAE